MFSLTSIAPLITQLHKGQITAHALAEQACVRGADPQGEGSRVFTRRYAERALVLARHSDQLRAWGWTRSPLEGIPISIKDLFDVAGETTCAGSKILREAAAATRHAWVVERLLSAGAVLVGRTNMTEFAYSGLGINPHHGTPLNPWDRAARRIPGGSSSGAAVSVSDGMAVAAIGSDTGGSVRIPAALCGLVGFKPTARRIPCTGMLPLSATLDSVGVIARSVADCACIDTVLVGTQADVPDGLVHFPVPMPDLRGVRFLMPTNLILDDADDVVCTAFEAALLRLSQAGARLVEHALPELDELALLQRHATFPAAESWAWHRRYIPDEASAYDPRVLARIRKGESIAAADLLALHTMRADWIRRVEATLAPFDALLMPTVPRIAPTLAELSTDEAYNRANALMLRNTAPINFLDGCALSLPCHEPGDAPVGLSLAMTQGQDRRLLALGAAVEHRLRR